MENSITKREYIIAHAPKVIPKWFEPVMPTKPVLLPYLDDKFGSRSDHPNKDTFMKHYFEGEWFTLDSDNTTIPASLINDVDSYSELQNIRIKEVDEWEKQYNIERSIQWPIYWADQILNKLQDEK